MRRYTRELQERSGVGQLWAAHLHGMQKLGDGHFARIPYLLRKGRYRGAIRIASEDRDVAVDVFEALLESLREDRQGAKALGRYIEKEMADEDDGDVSREVYHLGSSLAKGDFDDLEYVLNEADNDKLSYKIVLEFLRLTALAL